ncbi:MULTISPECIES: efflux RND transporter permease subunit [unclassified Pseudomonas]|uniref:efflux RND transporter permease subunit n=1 Tax=unclassified Pseudomonas TaxID=196821 RepID=UPI0007316538|nr:MULTISPECIES: efflux RND transporter permease subunit [unclassified Pseudomonas]KSW22454.1 multidrug transporter [Pseudomonas sp. ADP]OBP12368.1 multidrug efflux RND transporter permease [Pseudomonas sp. EGD-AKN5]QOF85261.1 efflux RND transporter permease subunit [Pseudomonas sp. ADPe]
MASFFINRPIFAWVIAIVIMLAGGLSILKLPVNQYPNIAAPAIITTVTYPGASAQTVQDTVVQPIEQQLNNLDGLRYISSESNADGSTNIIVTFDQGTDPDIAQVQVQNKLQLATPLLPEEVQKQGLRVAKYQINFMLIVGLYSEDGSMDDFDIGNYIASNLKDPITRTKGVGDFLLLGAQYAMRIWVDPQKLLSYQLTPQDVIDAVRAENVQVSSGALGGLPTHQGVQLNATVLGMSRMTTAAQFREILLKVNPDGSQVRLKDVAEVGLGSENFSISGTYNGKPAAAIALRLATGANLLDTVKRVHETVAELEPYFPKGLKVVYPYDTSPVVSASIHEVVKTLFEGILLVFLVMYLFMQNLRATLIPTLAVPVVLLGTFGVLAACGFTINTLTMFGMVLAIGLLVDDAIVVVENVERVMVEEGLSPREATRKSMGQIQGALVGIAMVLSAVFVPMAFFGGATGIIYRQFSVTIVSAMALSVLVAMIFTPALCATLLKPVHGHHEKKGFFGWFNRSFDRGAERYKTGVDAIARRKGLFLGIYGLIVVALVWLFPQIPSAFLPDEDQGNMVVQVQMPSNASAGRTQVVLDEIRDYLLHDEAGLIDSAYTVSGFNFAGRGQNSGMLFIGLKPWGERSGRDDTSIFALAQRLQARIAQIKDGTAIAIVPPAILEMGNATGFDLFLQDRVGLGHEKLMQARDRFLELAAADPVLKNVRPNGMNDEPQYQVVIDKEKARALQVSISDINATMSTAWGSAYVNDFVDRGRVKKVYVQGAIDSRISPEDFAKWYVRNARGEMVKFSAFASGYWTYGSPKLERYNGVPAVEIQGEPAPGYSSGDAMQAVARIVAQLPDGIGLQFTGISYEERLSGSQAPALYAISVLIVFLCLAALYESWTVPLAVIMVVPLGVIGAVLATLGRGLANDVFFQVGLLTTVGLSAKNAILIVEFAKALHEQGMPLLKAASEAARLRLRPIIMTSLAFVLGVLPLAISHGPGSGSQHSIGTGVVGGMLTATFLAVFFVPMFYVLITRLFSRKAKPLDAQQGEHA